MDEDIKTQLGKDPNGMLTYEYIANNIGCCDAYMPFLIGNMIAADKTGQFLASAAKYLYAIDHKKNAAHIDRLIEATIDKDREHRYLLDLLQGIWGENYADKADILNASDKNFRRIYKRLFPKGI